METSFGNIEQNLEGFLRGPKEENSQLQIKLHPIVMHGVRVTRKEILRTNRGEKSKYLSTLVDSDGKEVSPSLFFSMVEEKNREGGWKWIDSMVRDRKMARREVTTSRIHSRYSMRRG